MGVRCQGNSDPPADGATTPLSQCHAWLRNAACMAGPSLHNTQCSSPTLYTHTVNIELHGRRQAGSEGAREGEREN